MTQITWEEICKNYTKRIEGMANPSSKEAKKTKRYIAETSQLCMELQARLTFKTQTVISDEDTLNFLRFIVRFFDELPSSPVLTMDSIGLMVNPPHECNLNASKIIN
jgi:hypothetical protein